MSSLYSSPVAYTIRLVDTPQGIDDCLADLYPLPTRPPASPSSDENDESSSQSVPTVGVNSELVHSVPPLILAATEPLPSIAVDIEGIDLCRAGRVSIVQMVKDSGNIVYLLDVTTLGVMAFSHEDAEGRSIKKLLECSEIKKIIYDVRSDSDALYHIYGIDMKNVLDLQILELAWRGSKGSNIRFLNGLARSIESHVRPSLAWKQTKAEGRKLFAPNEGGSYSVFEKRPLDQRILSYCAEDVSYLHRLEKALRESFGRQGKNWDQRVNIETERRMNVVKVSATFEHGRHMAISPKI